MAERKGGATLSAATVRIGIAGLGRMGRRHAAQLARRTRGARLVAACSPLTDERDGAGREFGAPALYEDFAALLCDPQVQAVEAVA